MFKQCQKLIVKADFSFTGNAGRSKLARAGQVFIVTTSSTYNSNGGALISRQSLAKMGTGDYFTNQQILELFHVE
jgi:hypothetical protein